MRVLHELVRESLARVPPARSERRHALDRCKREVIAIELVSNDHIEWRRRRTFLDESVHVDVAMVRAIVREPVHDRGIAVVCEDHRFVAREEHVELAILEAVRMRGFRL